MHFRSMKDSVVKRWLVFNAVGAMGIAVQLATLYALTSYAGVGYLPATGLGVEAAIVHNFFWHERWTWADRRGAAGFFLQRFLGFHLANGAVSIIGNLVLMWYFVEKLGVGFLLSNTFAIALCSVVNFLAGDRIVFRQRQSCSVKDRKGSIHMTKKMLRPMARMCLLTATLFTVGLTGVQAAELQPGTLEAWNATVDKVERRISAELSSNQGFLALDFQSPGKATRDRDEVLSGKVDVRQIQDGGEKYKIPKGLIHHWRGVVFIPGVTLEYILSRLENPGPEDTKQEDVLESKILEKRPGQHILYLKLQRSKIVTVVYNTEHLVRYRRHGSSRAFSSSIATKIAEIENHRKGNEREKPEGRDHGYLWRMNSYWRYQESKGGVLVECESLTLSRSIPSLLEIMIRPLIRSVASESMQRTLESMRTRMVDSGIRIQDSQFKASIF